MLAERGQYIPLDDDTPVPQEGRDLSSAGADGGRRFGRAASGLFFHARPRNCRFGAASDGLWEMMDRKRVLCNNELWAGPGKRSHALAWAVSIPVNQNCRMAKPFA